MKGDKTMEDFMNVVIDALKGFFADFLNLLGAHINSFIGIETY